jgi:nucleotide-binding universal stress UspA family protein
MFRQILVPTDLTDRSRDAVATAARLAQPNGRITLFHVIEMIPDIAFEELQAFYTTLEKKARQRMREVTEDAAILPDVELVMDVVYGRRGEEILRFAAERQVDLIVLASHPPDPQQPALSLGSLSYKVSALAPCAVLLLK